MEIKNSKFDASILWKVASIALGIGGLLISTKIESNNQKTMKNELKEEILRDLTKEG